LNRTRVVENLNGTKKRATGVGEKKNQSVHSEQKGNVGREPSYGKPKKAEMECISTMTNSVK